MIYLVTVVDENDEFIYDTEIEADSLEEAFEVAMSEEALEANESIYSVEEISL